MAGNSKITKELMDVLFAELNELLAADNKNLELVLCGGAVMVIYEVRHQTDDFDNIKLISSEYYKYFEVLQSKYNLEYDWLNDRAEEMVPFHLPYEEWKQYSHLVVNKLTDEAMLAAKLKACRAKDEQDIEFFIRRLQITDKKAVENLCLKYGVPITEDMRNLHEMFKDIDDEEERRYLIREEQRLRAETKKRIAIINKLFNELK